MSVHDAPDCRTVEEIQNEVKKRNEGHKIARFLRSRNDKDTIAAWNLDLNKLLQVFNVCMPCPCSVATDLPPSRPSSI